jgi:hypothetical protein
MASTIAAGTTSGTAIAIAGDTSGVLQLQTNGTTAAVTIDTSQNVGIGTSSPAQKLDIASKVQIDTANAYGKIKIARATDSGVSALFIQGADNAGTANELSLVNAGGGGAAINITGGDLRFYATSNTTERMRIDTSGNVGIGVTSPRVIGGGYRGLEIGNASGASIYLTTTSDTYRGYLAVDSGGTNLTSVTAHPLVFGTSNAERMRIDSSGNAYIGKTTAAAATAGYEFNTGGSAYGVITNTRTDGVGDLFILNRQGSDGKLISFYQATTEEGNISVSGTTVSYNGGHLSRWSQLPDNSKDDTILKGTVLTNLDDMCVWTKDGTVLDNEQLNKMKVSDVEGDTNVAGVFVDWQFDEQCQSDDMNVAMTGDMIIRIAQGVIVQKGDLLMSAGDGTAKPQGDDICKSKTIAKVTSNHVTCTYADGSYCVPCVLMAC